MDDPVMARIGEAVALGHAGDPAAARRGLDEVWAELGPGGDPVHRCAIAHHAADLQDEPSGELRWDRLALAAADEVDHDRARERHPALDVRAFYPSLHLNLADVHRRLGNSGPAREHVERARASLDRLPDDGYGRMIRAAVDRCVDRIAAGDTS